MKRVAVLNDIHGNLPALETVVIGHSHHQFDRAIGGSGSLTPEASGFRTKAGPVPFGRCLAPK